MPEVVTAHVWLAPALTDANTSPLPTAAGRVLHGIAGVPAKQISGPAAEPVPSWPA
jgi:hypothetical protein